MIRSAVYEQLAPVYQQRLDLDHRTSARQSDLACRELETILGIGVLAFQNIRHRHLAWYADVEAKRVSYSVDDAQGFADEYQQWKDATEHWLAQVQAFEAHGYQVEHAAELRGFYEQVQLADLDVRKLVRSIEKLEHGGGVDAREFFASLRSRAPA
jgi:sulfur relay (sulfurtransferase) DsrC/TusE family protein